MQGPTGYRYQRYPDAEARLRSAILLTKRIVDVFVENSEELNRYSYEFLRFGLWKITEAQTRKYETRYCSGSIWESQDWRLPTLKERIRNTRHDHVFRCELMIPKLLHSTDQELELLIESSIGCVVTIDEHDRLTAHDRGDEIDGWSRYRRSGISVIDAETGSQQF
jgi:hypothetical protein